MRGAWLGTILLVGCGSPDIEGTWEGDCAMGFGTASSVLAMELDLDPSEDGEVFGVGLLEDADYGGAFPVAIEGTLDGKEIQLDLVYDLAFTPTTPTTTTTTTMSGASTTTGFDDFLPGYSIEAKVKGDTMEGKCLVEVMGFGFGADITLERQ